MTHVVRPRALRHMAIQIYPRFPEPLPRFSSALSLPLLLLVGCHLSREFLAFGVRFLTTSRGVMINIYKTLVCRPPAVASDLCSTVENVFESASKTTGVVVIDWALEVDSGFSSPHLIEIGFPAFEEDNRIR